MLNTYDPLTAADGPHLTINASDIFWEGNHGRLHYSSLLIACHWSNCTNVPFGELVIRVVSDVTNEIKYFVHTEHSASLRKFLFESIPDQSISFEVKFNDNV